MTKPKSEALGAIGLGAFTYWGNERVPDVSGLLASIKVVEAGAFIAWLGPRLAHYRVGRAAHNDAPQRAAVVAWMQKAERDVMAALDDGRLARGMPPLADAAAWHAAAKAGKDWREVVQQRDAVLIAAFLRAGRESLQRQKARRGHPDRKERDAILLDVTKRLRDLSGANDPDEVDRIAREILIQCGIPRLPDSDSIARSDRRRRVRASGQ